MRSNGARNRTRLLFDEMIMIINGLKIPFAEENQICYTNGWFVEQLLDGITHIVKTITIIMKMKITAILLACVTTLMLVMDAKSDVVFQDNFNGVISSAWQIQSNNSNLYSIGANGVTLHCCSSDMWPGNDNYNNLFLITNPAPEDFILTIKCQWLTPPTQDWGQIALVAYDNDDDYVRVDNLSNNNGTKYLELLNAVSGTNPQDNFQKKDFGTSPFWLQMRKQQTNYSSWFSTDGINFTQTNAPIIYTNGHPAKLGFVAMSATNQIGIVLVSSFTVAVPATNLTIGISGSQVNLSWPLTATNDFYVQYAPTLSTPINWLNASDPTTNSGNLVVTDYGTNTNRFYRLQAWQVLFDGTSTASFRGYQQTSFPGTNQWLVTTNGELMAVSNAAPVELITTNQYGSYELRWEWMTSTNGNSGVQYRANETYANSASAGPEYQLLDDLGYSSPANKTMGAVFALFAPTNKLLVPVGQWNECRLIIQGNHVQHWLNGSVVVDYYINSSAWTNALVAAGGAYNVAGMGQGTSPGIGYIMLRNDQGPTWFRNIKLRPLSAQ